MSRHARRITHPELPASGLVALCDESMRQRTEGSTGIYILSAIIAETAALPVIRDGMTGLLLRKQRGKLHWRAESSSRRDVLARKVGGLPAEIVVATFCGLIRNKQERARKKALHTLLLDLADRAVSAAILESRGDREDSSDIAELQRLRRTGALEPRLRMSHRLGADEPALWAADIAAGAYVAAHADTGKHWATLQAGGKVTVLTCSACGSPHLPGSGDEGLWDAQP
ncbi:hypothetical protein [Streptomyces sp. NPDC057854]|uniref:hypothetical protein n=1 Tax=unclassified Streptomyces TaxID=2593676 RepID=UPI0036D04B22